MMLIDLTRELSPLLFGLDALFVFSTAALFGLSAIDALARTLRRNGIPRLVVHRPALAR